ncbi:schlafen-like protein 1 [Dendronephthya gigantea]|uniref:schlafen-like protein 1 n=1 Tax=Dendronephthya gigantea TaxID=151771 RepID=UPI00106A8174|nr:schlafen-like protein 1 [Dendronephthya gigantea]XP_028390882.1 schlafen-like protein 1 [Dendronephthya gigantea]
MLNRAINFLKRKRNEKEEKSVNDGTSQAIVPYSATQNQKDNVPKKEVKSEGLFARAFRRIKRRIFRVCQPHVPAICLCKTPANGTRTQARYEITPHPRDQSDLKSLLPRAYYFNHYVSMRESRTFEFKTGGGAYPIQILPEHIRKYGTAFLNSNGGILIAGILDNGLIKGIYCDRRMEDRIRSTLEKEVSQFYPPVDRSLYSVNFVPVYDQMAGQYIFNRKIVEIIFKGGEPLALYESGDHKVFLKREGSVEGPLSPLQIKDVVLRKYRTVLAERREQNLTLLSP